MVKKLVISFLLILGIIIGNGCYWIFADIQTKCAKDITNGKPLSKDDIKIAKNYLSEIELQRLNLLVSGFLDFAEFQALEMNPMSMQNWIEALDNQILSQKLRQIVQLKLEFYLQFHFLKIQQSFLRDNLT